MMSFLRIKNIVLHNNDNILKLKPTFFPLYSDLGVRTDKFNVVDEIKIVCFCIENK